MGRKFIPNWRRASFPISTRWSKRSRQSCDCARPGSAFLCLGRIQGETPNAQHPTSNIQPDGLCRRRCRCAAFGSWALDVRGSVFRSYTIRRVMGAWWPSRSSKPLSARLTSRGMFDSYPLRQFHLRFALCDLPFEDATWTAWPAAAPLAIGNRKSQIVNPKKGGGRRVTRTGP